MATLELLVSWVVAVCVVGALMLLAAVMMLDHRPEDSDQDQQDTEEGF